MSGNTFHLIDTFSLKRSIILKQRRNVENQIDLSLIKGWVFLYLIILTIYPHRQPLWGVSDWVEFTSTGYTHTRYAHTHAHAHTHNTHTCTHTEQIQDTHKIHTQYAHNMHTNAHNMHTHNTHTIHRTQIQDTQMHNNTLANIYINTEYRTPQHNTHIPLCST